MSVLLPSSAAAAAAAAAAAQNTARATNKSEALRPVRLNKVTPAEQIAQHLGQAILQGKFGPGERIGEQAVANMFSVSRGPVRDALRELDKQGLVEISPRRGAFVVQLVLNDVVDIFNIRGTMMGLAARYLAINPAAAALEMLDARLDELRLLAQREDTSLVEFVKAVGRMGTGLIQHCGNRQLVSTYRNLPHDAVWQMLWVNNNPVDYDRAARRLESLRGYQHLLAAIRAGRVDEAETGMRKIVTDSCKEVVAHMRLTRTEDFDEFRLLVV
jgi:DNA-binding GntR family transcriptional regulator